MIGEESKAGAAPTAVAPRDALDVAEALAAMPGPFEIVGGGSKRLVGRPTAVTPLYLNALDGVLDYEPAELVLRARAGTPLAVVERLLASERQRLAFEPPDYAGLLDTDAMPTLGGVCAANVSGSRRVAAGAPRDHLLGCRAVNGRGEPFVAGGRVVKNVTGYDLPKVLCGSWGTLAVFTELTLRVVPAAETECTLAIAARSPEQALDVMTRALGSPCEVSSAAFDPEQGALLRLEGFAASVRARADRLHRLLGGESELLGPHESRRVWHAVGAAEALAPWPVVWRISMPPSDVPRRIAALQPERYLLDWGGGLVWAAFRGVDAARVRSAAASGHATLFKAPAEARAATAVFPPQPPALAALAARLKAAFDPEGKLTPGRLD